MTFTDAMLNGLKAHVEACDDCQTCSEMGLGHLISRLEAAEKVCNSWPDAPAMLDAVNEWRKEAGK